MMKKTLLLIGIILSFASCSIDDDENTTYTTELVPVVSVEIPDTLIFRKNYTFTVTYKKLSDCHVFDGYVFEKEQDTLFFGVVNAVYMQDNCEPLTDETATADLNFFVENTDFYIFKFWQGKNNAGEPIYLTKEVPVKME